MNASNRLTSTMGRAALGLGAVASLGTLAAVPMPAQAAAPAQCQGDLTGGSWLNVEVTGVKSSSGIMAVTIYADDSSRFLAKKGSLDVVRFPARAGTFRGCVKLPKNGVYAIAVYHDADGSRNHRADRRFANAAPRTNRCRTRQPILVMVLVLCRSLVLGS